MKEKRILKGFWITARHHAYLSRKAKGRTRSDVICEMIDKTMHEKKLKVKI